MTHHHILLTFGALVVTALATALAFALLDAAVSEIKKLARRHP